MNAIVAVALRAPRVVIGIWITVLLASAFFALKLDGSLSGGGFTNPRAEAITTQQTIEAAFNESPNQLAVVLDSDSELDRTLLTQAVEKLTIAGASSITTPEQNPAFASQDGSAALILAGFDQDNTTVQNLVPGLQSELDALAGQAASAYVTGGPALDYQLNAHSKEDATRAELIVFPLLIIVLLFVFGSVVATLVPLLMAGSALAIASAIGFGATQFTDISNLYSNIVSMIGLAVAVDYSLFIIKRFREELAQGSRVQTAVRTAMSTAGHSVLFSGIAVILALAALFIPNVMAFTSIALGGIVVTGIALVLTMTVLPAVLALLGRNINRWQLPWAKKRIEVKDISTQRLTSRPGVVSAIGITVMLALALPIAGLSLQSPVASATVLPAGDSARTGLEVIEEKIGQEGLFPIQVVLSTDAAADPTQALSATDATVKYLQNQDGVGQVIAVTTLGLDPTQLAAMLRSGDVPADLQQLWAVLDGEQITRVIVQTQVGPDSVRAHDLVADLRADLPQTIGDQVYVAVTGATAQGLDFDQTLVDAIPLVAALVFLLTFVMLLFAFRSLVLPLLALFFNTLVVGASLGILTMIQNAVSDVPLNSVTPILLFAVMFGLSMDYMVIIIARMSEAYRNGANFEDAIRTGVARTRTMINSAALIMVTVFLAFVTGKIAIVREIGIGLALAVIFDALVIRMIIMPAVLRVLGPRVFGKRNQPQVITPQAAPERELVGV